MTSRNESDEVKDVAVYEAERAVSAAFIASGIGAFVLGLSIVLSEANAGLKTALTWSKSVGALSGKSGISVIAFLLSWVILHYAFKNSGPSLRNAFTITLVLLALGFLMCYPPIFEALVHLLSGGA